MGLRRWIAEGWQKRGGGAVMLLPLALLFALSVNLRRLAYRRGWASSVKLPVPVVVVGNISAGGSGKTPLVLYLAQQLLERGWRPGIVSRGYGGSVMGVEAVSATSDPGRSADELCCLRAARVARSLSAATRHLRRIALLAAHPDCNVLIADDGLQHLRLVRDVEIVVMDERGIGNGWPLPAGPLRECPARIAEAHALVLNGTAQVPADVHPQRLFRMQLAGDRFRNLHDPQRDCSAEALRGRRLHALAGIGHPERFFRQIEQLGLQVQTHAFPDHHAFQPSDLAIAGADALLMTDKDAVKCQAFAPPETWVLPVEAQLEPDLAQWLVEKLNG